MFSFSELPGPLQNLAFVKGCLFVPHFGRIKKHGSSAGWRAALYCMAFAPAGRLWSTAACSAPYTQLVHCRREHVDRGFSA